MSWLTRSDRIDVLPILISWLAKCVSACLCLVTDSSSVCVIGFETVSTAASLEFMAPSMIEIYDKERGEKYKRLNNDTPIYKLKYNIIFCLLIFSLARTVWIYQHYDSLKTFI